jgi:hypothetical protein
VQLPFVGKTSRQAVQPDGNIAVEGIGAVYVNGKTIEETRLAIMQKAFESNPQAARANFGVFVEVAAKNSKQAYIILEGGECGETEALPVPPPPVAGVEFPVLPHPMTYYPPIVPAEPHPSIAIAFDRPAQPPMIRYSAIPVAAPSPFSLQPSVIQASPSSIPEPAYAPAALPQPAPTHISANSAPCAESTSWARDGKRVEFEIAVVMASSWSAIVTRH